MSRRAGVSAMLGAHRRVVLVAAVIGALMLAPEAAALEYKFVASNGTVCTLAKSHASTPEPDGEWTLGFDAALTCDGFVWGAQLSTYLSSGPWSSAAAGSSCDGPYPYGRRPCGAWALTGEGTASDRPWGVYNHDTWVRIVLANVPGTQAPDPVWLVAPAASGCTPGGNVVDCFVRESFTPH